MLRLAGPPPHPDLLHSPSQTGVNALMARGEKETAARLGNVRNRLEGHNGKRGGRLMQIYPWVFGVIVSNSSPRRR
jgi:hypothetical protein